MADLLQIFTGNPLSTFVGKKIEAATRPELDSEDWALNIEICDIINENDDDAKDAARAIRKRLQQIEQDRNFTITNRTLTVLETCVSNCSHRFHILVMTKDFIQDLVKLIGPKNNPPIDLQERVLRMIERWAEAFRSQPDLSGVVSVYNELKAKGVTFPPMDPGSHVPIQTPQRTMPGPTEPILTSSRRSGGPARPISASSGGNPMMSVSPNQPPLASGQVLLEGEGYNKITQDLVVVQSSIEMFEDIMRVLESPANQDADWKLAGELSVTCHQMKDRIVDLIERIANEDLTIELLRLNDDLNNVFTNYQNLFEKRSKHLSSKVNQEKESDLIAHGQSTSVLQQNVQANRPPTTSTTLTPISGDQKPKLAGVSSSTLDELSQIDFHTARAPGKSTSELSTATSEQPAADTGVFDNLNTNLENKQPTLNDRLSNLKLDAPVASSPTTNKTEAGVTKEGSSGTKLPEEISSVREQDFAEIENWLASDSGRDLTSIGGDMPSIDPISVPNSEFENFIASRALAGSNPSSQQQTKRQQQSEPST